MMTGTALSSRIQAAQNVRRWLQDKGCQEVAARLFNHRALIEVSCPPAELLHKAQRITESYAGVTRSVWTVFYNGCQIIWR
ncbi:hypothetical protein OVA10_03600 [Lelliottia sp. SL45]|uniref:hypothetical protein n=1 Tax=Lelliottia sp. SL45 TaxID=2994665 RepID=UPI0022762D5B|nr:hypothetical protein [Lelliottia sp. SL45]MCY1697174.1 hypothetical protein [Lelliottia sp. SL45]